MSDQINDVLGYNDDVLERPRDFAAKIGASLSTVWRRIKTDPSFPQPVRVGPNTVAFRRSDRLRWMARLPIATETAAERGRNRYSA